MANSSPLLLRAILNKIEIKGEIETGLRRDYSVKIYAAGKAFSRLLPPQPLSSVLSWELNTDNEIWFEPSSAMKIVLYRGLALGGNFLKKTFVGQCEGKVIDLLETNISYELKDQKGTSIPAEMSISLSGVSGSVDDVHAFMAKVDANVSRLTATGAAAGTVSMLGQVVKLTKTILDKVSQTHPILSVMWAVVCTLYEVVQDTDVQDEHIRGLASTLRELLGAANAIPDLAEIPDTTNVIESISRQSLEASSLIHEYTKVSRAGRIIKNQIPGGLKSRIDACQKSCANMKDGFHLRVNIDTNTQVKENGRKLEVIVDNQEAERIRKWLSPPDSSGVYNEAQKTRQPDTCLWFLNGKRFLDWKAKPGFLWVNGKVGSGKSVICSSAINQLLDEHQDAAITYFFFDGRGADQGLQFHDGLLRSLIAQFVHHRGGIPSESELARIYARLSDNHQPSVKQLQEILHDMSNRFSNAYIVVDALDECADRGDTLIWLNDLLFMGGKAENIHILITSRPEPDIAEAMQSIDLNPVDVGAVIENPDIAKYLAVQMESMRFRKYDENTRKDIQSYLSEHVDGSFRWVALQIAELAKCSSNTQIQQRLNTLPKGVEDTYARILKAVDPVYWEDTKTFLEWIAFSRRPLTVREVAETIMAKFEEGKDPIFDVKNRYYSPGDILVRCSSLVSKSEDDVVKLSHFSVKEYLLSCRAEDAFRINEKNAESRISEISVVYLLQFNSEFWTPYMHGISTPALSEYAAQYWIDHANMGAMEPSLMRSIFQLLTHNSPAFKMWIDIYNRKSWPRYPESPLYCASDAGFKCVSELLIQSGEDVNWKGGTYGNALQAASHGGHKAIIQLLLENGADVNAEGGTYGNALQAASFKGHKAIVELLLENGADVNTEGGNYGNALYAASFGGHEAIVQLLLENGANANAEGGEYGNALQAASSEGLEAIVQLLLENGANANAEGGYYGNALQAASYKGHEAIVNLLLENGADMDAKGGRYGNALLAASYGGHKAIIQLLVENGADMDAKGGHFGYALQAVSFGGHEAIINLLLKKGVDVNTEGGRYGNALQAASFGGHEAIVQLLLENGANANAEGGYYGNALQAASFGGHEAIVQLLLENGANANAEGGEYGNALQAASSEGLEAIVQLLLENGANANAEGGEYGNALQAASFGGHEAIIQLLLEKGADVNVEGGWLGNALHAASYPGHEAIVKLLVDKSPWVTLKADQLEKLYGGTLILVSAHRLKALVKELVQNGVKFNVQGFEKIMGYAAFMASCRGRHAILEYLLENGADVTVLQGISIRSPRNAPREVREAIRKIILNKYFPSCDFNIFGEC